MHPYVVGNDPAPGPGQLLNVGGGHFMAEEKPKKRWHQRWWFRILMLVVALFLVGRVVIKEFGGAAAATCKELAPDIIELSEDSKNPLQPRLIKLYDIQASEAPDDTYVLACEATATMSNGNNSWIFFYMTKDSDGDIFIGYNS